MFLCLDDLSQGMFRMLILITGASSQPGFKLLLEALEKDYEIIATYRTNEIPTEHENLRKVRIDLTDFEATRKLIENSKPEVIFHIAAYGDVDGCEQNRDYAWRINYLATQNIAKTARKIGSFIIYLSTDYVFDGERGNYREDDPAYPVNFYGLTKLLGEVATLSATENSAVVRASAIYGLGPGRKNFAKFLIEKLSRNEEIGAFTDQYLSPSNSNLLAKALLEIAERRLIGIFHVVGERMSRYEFALRVAEKLGFNRSLIKEASMSKFHWKARRPRDSSLNYDKTKSILKTEFYSTELALEILKREYLELHG